MDSPAAAAAEEIISVPYTGNLVSLGDDGTLRGLVNATVKLTCLGQSASEENHQQTTCASQLVVTTTNAGKERVVATLADAPGIDFHQGDGNAGSVTLDTLTLLEKSNAALIVVRTTKRESQGSPNDYTEYVHDYLYMIQGDTLAAVMDYESAATVELDPSPDQSAEQVETTLALGKRRTNGVFELVMTKVATVREWHHKNPHVEKTVTRYLWTGSAYDACVDRDTNVKHCGSCGHACAAGEGCCRGTCTPLDSAWNCGACNHRCPGENLEGSLAICTDVKSQRCDLVCRGDHYDVDGEPSNGCEKSGPATPYHTPQSALLRGARGCGDRASADQFSGLLVSDGRVHREPAVASFATAVGAAPDFIAVKSEGGWLCWNDLAVTLETRGGGDVPCYALTVLTDKKSGTITTTGHGSAVLAMGMRAYSSGSTVTFKIEKTCSQPMAEAVSYTVSYHL